MKLLESTACALILGMIAAGPVAAAESDASEQSAKQEETSGPAVDAQRTVKAETRQPRDMRPDMRAAEMEETDAPGDAAGIENEVAETDATEEQAETAEVAGRPETHLDAVLREVEERLAESFKADSETEREQDEHGALVEFYAEHNHDPVWVEADGLNDRGRAAVETLAGAADYGLKPADYARPELETAPDENELPAAKLAEAEITLSRSVLAYTRDARGGRLSPQSLSEYLDPTLDLPDPLEVMETILERDDPASYLRGFHPRHEQFEALRQSLLEIRGDAPEERVHVPAGPTLRTGDEHAHVAVVRERLQTPAGYAPAERFDAGLEKAVRKFQKANGLKADGIVGPATRRAMNQRPKNRERTILANMERWRWLPDDDDSAGTLNVQVNIPEFTIRVFEDGEVIHRERVVVGTVKNQTPVFSDEMERIVFHPYWNVPDSIKVEEILPNLRQRTRVRRSGFGFFDNVVSTQGNPRWMARNNLRIKYDGRRIDSTEVDWNRVDIRKFHFYQPPGGPNVLGVVKFMFPNKHAVYMHDTPSKHLFNQSVRAESHGCMRVRNPDRLAEILLSRDAGWTRARVHNAIANEGNRPIELQNPVPVHTTYFTAKVREDGSIRYLNDLYGHDARIARALGFE